MIYWLRLFGILFLICCVFAVVGALLPRAYDFEVTQTIDATPEQIFEELAPLTKWSSWTHFNAENENIFELSYAKEDLEMRWKDARGRGKLWITDDQSPDELKYSMQFGSFPEMKSTIRLSPRSDDKTDVHWRSTGRLPAGPFYGYSGLFFSNGMRSFHGQNLQKLKSVCEQ